MTFQQKAIILDMDGTMLNHRNEVSDNLNDYLKQLRSRGELVFIATGRTRKEISDVAPADLEVDGIVCANGMVIYEGNEQIMKHTLSSDLVIELVQKARELKVYYEIHPDEGPRIALKEDKSYFHEQIAGTKPETVKEDEWLARKVALEKDIEWTDELTLDSVAKIYFFSRDKEKNTEWKNWLKEVSQRRNFSAFSSSDHNIEIMEEEVSKATGINYLLKRFYLTSDQVMMIGDSENDLPLMEIAGHAVAMRNAPDQIKEKADEVTEFSYKEDGLYRFLSGRIEAGK